MLAALSARTWLAEHATVELLTGRGPCDGDLTARQIFVGVAVLRELDPDAVTGHALPVLRGLVADGFLR